MKLRIRRSGRHRAEQAADLQEPRYMSVDDPEYQIIELVSGRCRGVTYRRQPCTLDAGPDGYCVFHKPGATA